jgi:hypothetical protein
MGDDRISVLEASARIRAASGEAHVVGVWLEARASWLGFPSRIPITGGKVEADHVREATDRLRREAHADA